MKELEKLRETFLIQLSSHDALQRTRDVEAQAAREAALARRYGKVLIREAVPFTTNMVSGASIARPLTAEETREAARPRSRLVRAPAPVSAEAPLTIAFSPVWQSGRLLSADAIVAELRDAEGIVEVVQIEAVSRPHIFALGTSWTTDAFGKPIAGHLASVYIDTSLRDTKGSRVFCEILGPADDASGLVLGELRAFTEAELPEGLPENVDLQEYAAAERRQVQADWARRHVPTDAADKQREREAATLAARVEEGVAAALAKRQKEA